MFNVAIDCNDLSAQIEFWSRVMETPVAFSDDHEAVIEFPDGPNLFFQRVPEPKTVKNRVHVCLRPSRLRELEVARLVDVGATVVSDHRTPDGAGWVVLADPEGNEFCVLRSDAEREAQQS
ncbi:putative enzyme related to lactoylglutathione lyase [Stackebrandtia albiflava]|uniref:Putative enzyme related to lactoylglutathione lyase n=2 Tax=Stackebrandtia albiflava TaxID=406432 RepID=A0A562V507_9ACTN|nr:putative enzyme related to lactoylglutathione lyase [Stackebrandtia albiflava]